MESTAWKNKKIQNCVCVSNISKLNWTINADSPSLRVTVCLCLQPPCLKVFSTSLCLTPGRHRGRLTRPQALSGVGAETLPRPRRSVVLGLSPLVGEDLPPYGGYYCCLFVITSAMKYYTFSILVIRYDLLNPLESISNIINSSDYPRLQY